MNFLNSPQWREFQEKTGRKTFDIGPSASPPSEQGEAGAASPERAQARDGGRRENGYAIKIELPLGKSYLYSPSPDALDNLDEVKKIAKRESAVFFKYEPMIRLEQEITNNKSQITNKFQTPNLKQLQKQGFKEAVKALQPQRTIILNLEKGEDELLSQMHSKARYNVRLAQKKGVEIKISEDKEKDFEKFWSLMQKTTERDGFSAHRKDYYRKLLGVEGVELFFASKDKKPAASAIIIFHENRATYLHGASDHELRKFMAPHLMHWEIIKHAKEKGIKEYDLWGIDEKKWPGVTRFKRGFGGEEVEYVGSYDLPLQKLWYLMYKIKNAKK